MKEKLWYISSLFCSTVLFYVCEIDKLNLLTKTLNAMAKNIIVENVLEIDLKPKNRQEQVFEHEDMLLFTSIIFFLFSYHP